MRAAQVTTLALGLVACASPPTDTGDAASVADLADLGHVPCVLPAIALDVEPPTGVPQTLYVHVTREGQPAALYVDTGSELTFIHEPVGTQDPLPDAATVSLGCETLTLVGRPEEPLGSVGGVPVIGTFGTDQLLGGPSKLDFVRGLIERHAPRLGFPEAAAWPAAPYDVSQGIVLPHVELDGTPVRLEVDTGAGAVVWMGAQPHAGDTQIDTEDAEGNPITIYMGTVTLTVGGWSGVVPCARIPVWPYFAENVELLGGNIAGLIGMSALGSGFVIDTDTRMFRVNPSP